MSKKSFISVHDYSYTLPEQRIAKYPLPLRESSKLLEYKNGQIRETLFKNIHELLPCNSIIFINNTKVIHARLLFRRATGAAIEIFCVLPYDPADYQAAFSAVGHCSWKCLVGNSKKWKNEPLFIEVEHKRKKLFVKAERAGMLDGDVIVNFSWNNTVSFGEVIEIAGIVPIPPYLNRNAEAIDNDRYQTVYSKVKGSVAAPTAGFHFTSDIINRLKRKNIGLKEITLHVGTGTFQPVKSLNVTEHMMHHEYFSLTVETLKELVTKNKPIIATGTTTLRTLESVYWLAIKSIKEKKIPPCLNQWDHTTLEPFLPAETAILELISLMQKQNMRSLSAETGIMIVPGYEFQLADILITNFHLPRSTLLLLIAAFIGDDWKKVYQYALNHDFRFLSYGDSSLLHRA